MGLIGVKKNGYKWRTKEIATFDLAKLNKMKSQCKGHNSLNYLNQWGN